MGGKVVSAGKEERGRGRRGVMGGRRGCTVVAATFSVSAALASAETRRHMAPRGSKPSGSSGIAGGGSATPRTRHLRDDEPRLSPPGGGPPLPCCCSAEFAFCLRFCFRQMAVRCEDA